MRVYLSYAFKETFSNLWRNRMMTLAAVLTVAVSLSLVGGALFLKQSAAQATASWQNGTQVRVWMQSTASAGEITAANPLSAAGRLTVGGSALPSSSAAAGSARRTTKTVRTLTPDPTRERTRRTLGRF
jgi:cell division protein FtsX